MRVLTVRQPWAWAIIHGGKDVENRTRNIAGSYRGPVAIHASKREEPIDHWSRSAIRDLTGVYPLFTLNSGLGAVIGVVDLVDVHHDDDCGPDAADAADGLPSAWAMSDHHHLVLSNPRPLPRPIPATGRLGLWRPDDDLLAAITEQLTEAPRG